MNELILEILRKEPSGLTFEQIAERVAEEHSKIREAIAKLRTSDRIRNANTRRSGRAVYQLVQGKKVEVNRVTSKGKGCYDGRELTDKTNARPGSHDFERLPSRWGNRLFYRDGRIETL